MQGKLRWAAWGTLALGVGCTGEVASEGPNNTSAQARLVQDDAHWLESYAGHCEGCFGDFRDCGGQAQAREDFEACRHSLRACVTAGMDRSADALEAGGGAESTAPSSNGSEHLATPGADAGSAEARDGGTASGDGGVAPGAAPTPAPRAAIEACLTGFQDCLARPAADAFGCLDGVRGCVHDALLERLDALCDQALQQAEQSSRPAFATETVERACGKGLQLPGGDGQAP